MRYINHISTPIPIYIDIYSNTILLLTANTQVSPAPGKDISPSTTCKYNYSLTHISTPIPIHIVLDSYTILLLTANTQVSPAPPKDISPSATGKYHSYINYLSTPIPIHIDIDFYIILLFTANIQGSTTPSRDISRSSTCKYNYSLTHISTPILSILPWILTLSFLLQPTPKSLLLHQGISQALPLVSTTILLLIYPPQFLSILT